MIEEEELLNKINVINNEELNTNEVVTLETLQRDYLKTISLLKSDDTCSVHSVKNDEQRIYLREINSIFDLSNFKIEDFYENVEEDVLENSCLSVNEDAENIYEKTVENEENNSALINASFISYSEVQDQHEHDLDHKERKNVVFDQSPLVKLRASETTTTDFESASENNFRMNKENNLFDDAKKLINIAKAELDNSLDKNVNENNPKSCELCLESKLSEKSNENKKSDDKIYNVGFMTTPKKANQKNELDFLISDLNNLNSIRYKRRTDQMKKRKELFEEKASKKSYEENKNEVITNNNKTHDDYYRNSMNFNLPSKQYMEYDEASNQVFGLEKNILSSNKNLSIIQNNINTEEDVEKEKLHELKPQTKARGIHKRLNFNDLEISKINKPIEVKEVEVVEINKNNLNKKIICEEVEVIVSELDSKEFDDDSISPINRFSGKKSFFNKNSNNSVETYKSLEENTYKKILTKQITESVIVFKNMLKYKYFPEENVTNFTNSYLMALASDNSGLNKNNDKSFKTKFNNNYKNIVDEIISEKSENSSVTSNASNIMNLSCESNFSDEQIYKSKKCKSLQLNNIVSEVTAKWILQYNQYKIKPKRISNSINYHDGLIRI